MVEALQVKPVLDLKIEGLFGVNPQAGSTFTGYDHWGASWGGPERLDAIGPEASVCDRLPAGHLFGVQ
jgi:hypothetical protein